MKKWIFFLKNFLLTFFFDGEKNFLEIRKIFEKIFENSKKLQNFLYAKNWQKNCKI